MKHLLLLLSASLVFAGLVLAGNRPDPGASPEPHPPRPLQHPARSVLMPLFESGALTPEQAQALIEMDLDQVLATLRRPETSPLTPLDHINSDCLAPPRLDRPAEPDSFDVDHYSIQILEVNESVQYLSAVTTITLTAQGPLASLDLDLAKATVTDVSMVMSGTTNAFITAYVHRDSVLTVTFAPPIIAGMQVDVRVAYEGSDIGCLDHSGLFGGAVFSLDGVHTFSEPVFARYWYPCHDVPWDKATYTLALKVPAGRKGSAAGVLIDSTQVGGLDSLTYSIPTPVSPYLPAFYIHDYVKLTDVATIPGTMLPEVRIPLEYYVYPELAAKAGADFQNLPDMMRFFYTIYPYPNPRYAMSLGWFGGGMEHQMNSLIGKFFIRGDRQWEHLFVHELAHQWWGNLVTMNAWNEIWLNEGFATYAEWLFAEHHYGGDARLTEVALVDSIYMVNIADPESPIQDHPLRAPNPDKIFSWVVYQKGGRVLDMLRGVSRLLPLEGQSPQPSLQFAIAASLGDQPFLEIFTRYLSDHANGNVVSQDFIDAAEAELGVNLSWFFDPWLNGWGYPQYTYDWKQRAGVSGATLDVIVSQPAVRLLSHVMPVHIRYQSETQALDEVRRIGPGSTQWTVNLPAGDWEVLLDPDDWVMETHTREAIFPNFTASGAYPNPSSSGFTFSGELTGSRTVPGLLAVYDLQGRRIRNQDLGTVGPGPLAITWDARDDTGRRVAGGVYYARLTLGFQSDLRRLVVLP